MSLREQGPDLLPAAERLAKALRSGLHLRWSIPSTSPEVESAFPPGGKLRPFLEPFADSLRYPLPRGRNPLLRLVYSIRYLVRKVIGPWLYAQTHFNLSALSVIEQVEQRLQSLEEAERSLRQAMRTLEKMFLCRVDGDLAQQVETLEEGLRLRVNRELGPQGDIARAGLWFHPPVVVEMDETGPRVAGVTQRILEHIFIHTHLPRPPARLLALGCGDSTNAIEMASLGFEVVGVDARGFPLKHPNFTLIQGQCDELPFEDESFDAAVALAMLGDEKTAGEVFRVLKPGGRFLVTLPRLHGRRDFIPHGFRVLERGYGVRQDDAWTYALDEPQADAVCLMALEKP